MLPDQLSLRPSLPADFIGRINRLRLTTTDTPWPFATDNRAAIADHFERRRDGNPAFFDGQVFVLRQLSREPDAITGTFSLERFSAFLYWRDGVSSDSTILDGFATAVVRSAEGHVLAGRAAGDTLNAGRVYLPGGFIDARDRRPDGTIDIDASVARELAEETGLAVADLARMPGYIVARHGRHCCFAIEYRSPLTAAALLDRVRSSFAATADGELTELLAIASADDLARHDVLDHARFLVSHVLGDTL